MDPQIIADVSSFYISLDQFEGLTRYDVNGEPEPGLAKEWQVSSDGLIWTFTLRKGLTFSDGHPIMPEVFVKALARIRDEKTGSPHMALFAIIDRIEPAGSREVKVILREPFPQLPALLSYPALAALPFHIIEEQGSKWTAQRPLVTSGPYQLTEWKLAQAATLQANPRWHGGKPASQTIIWKPVENAQSSMRLMLAGGGDTSDNFPSNRIGWMKENYPELLRLSDTLGTYYYVFNTRHPPFDDRRVRKALALVIDREWITQQMIAAGNAPAIYMVPPALRGKDGRHKKLGTKEQRLRKARQLMAEAGYSEDRPLRFEIRFNNSVEHRRVAVAIATMWREIGAEARMLNSEAGLHFDAMRRGEFEVARAGWIADLPAPENFLYIHRADAGSQNYSGYSNPAFDAALDIATAERDPAERQRLMQVAEDIMIDDQPLVPIYYYGSRNLIQPNIAGWQANIANVHPSRFLYKRQP